MAPRPMRSTRAGSCCLGTSTRSRVFEDTAYGKPFVFDAASYRPVSPAPQAHILHTIHGALDLSDIPGGHVGL